MVKEKDGTDSVESFEMEVAEKEEEEEEESDEDDDDDEVFVKKGRHGSENGSAKKPLIRGDSIQHLFPIEYNFCFQKEFSLVLE